MLTQSPCPGEGLRVSNALYSLALPSWLLLALPSDLTDLCATGCPKSRDCWNVANVKDFQYIHVPYVICIVFSLKLNK